MNENKAIEIELGTQGYRTIVGPEDADLVEWNWHLLGSHHGKHIIGHVARQMTAAETGSYKIRKQIQMSRIILERILGAPIPDGLECDHINGDTLDNRRENLRLATRSENNRNRRGWGQYGRGVRHEKRQGQYQAVITLGSFDTPEEAQLAWAQAANLLRGQFTVGNDRLTR